MTLTSGTRLGTYEIVAPLGAGGMGEVYRARDTRLGRDVAVKVLPSQLTASVDRLARLEREARTIAGLNHPNIVTLYSLEDEGGIRFLSMELVDGQSLDRLLAPGGLPLARVLQLAIPLAGALVAAHERGVTHRDLKPGNVMVTHDGWVKVLDFGLAKTASGANDPADQLATVAAGDALSAEGQVLGTVPYMAPEQVRGEPADARSDLFALGILLYELATGRRPFTGGTSADVSSSILRDTPVPAVQIRADLPRDLNRIIARCLEKDPRDRFQTARDVYNELRYVQRELEPAPVTRVPAPGSSRPAPGRESPSIAVLPFVNRSSSAEDEYFSDGLADELLNVLTKIRGLRVAARASSFQFRGKNEDVAAIGEKLNVATLLDGSVRKAGNRVRISVQLVKAADRVQLWSETYDRSLDDIFAVQDDIAQSVVKELRTTLLGESEGSEASGRARADVAAAVMGHGRSPEAHRLYLQGKYFVERMSGESVRWGIRYLEQALALDPSHAAAWSVLSRAHTSSGGYGWEPVMDAFRLAREAAIRALELAPGLAEAHVALSMIQRWHDWDWAGAERSVRRALELAPENAEAVRAGAWLALHVGRFAEAESLMLRAIEQDPLNTDGHVGIGLVYRSAGRLEEAERAFRKAMEINPQEIRTRHVLAMALADQGRHAEALAATLEEPADWARLTGLAFVHHKAGRRAESEAALRQLEREHAKDSGFQIAAIHALRGEADAAFEWLERAYAERDAGISLLKQEPSFAAVHGDPRWGAFIRRLGLED
jgi:serine/threonine protein kinase/Tfp pilus assembly protein PilF